MDKVKEELSDQEKTIQMDIWTEFHIVGYKKGCRTAVVLGHWDHKNQMNIRRQTFCQRATMLIELCDRSQIMPPQLLVAGYYGERPKNYQMLIPCIALFTTNYSLGIGL